MPAESAASGEYIIAGPRRSGLHAVAAWIHRDRPEATLANDVDLDDLAKCVPGRIAIAEDKPLPKLASSLPARPQTHVIAAYRVLLILRDPRNLAASRLEYAARRPHAAGLVKLKRGMMIWDQIADQATGGTRHLPLAVVVIYDLWHRDAGYRLRAGRRLGLQDPGPALNAVPRFGGGSSFDGQKHDGQAGQMMLLTRYRQYIHNPDWQSALTPTRLATWHKIVKAAQCT